MWICPRCGEGNEDSFKECWKCISDEIQGQGTATPPPLPAPPRRVRSLGSVLIRVAIGFAVGMLIGLVIFHRNATPLAEAAVAGAIGGGVLAGSVGVFVWVLFPYEPGPASNSVGEVNED